MQKRFTEQRGVINCKLHFPEEKAEVKMVDPHKLPLLVVAKVRHGPSVFTSGVCHLNLLFNFLILLPSKLF